METNFRPLSFEIDSNRPSGAFHISGPDQRGGFHFFPKNHRKWLYAAIGHCPQISGERDFKDIGTGMSLIFPSKLTIWWVPWQWTGGEFSIFPPKPQQAEVAKTKLRGEHRLFRDRVLGLKLPPYLDAPFFDQVANMLNPLARAKGGRVCFGCPAPKSGSRAKPLEAFGVIQGNL